VATRHPSHPTIRVYKPRFAGRGAGKSRVGSELRWKEPSPLLGWESRFGECRGDGDEVGVDGSVLFVQGPRW
jgi:hypothetical protein